jgi:hypothetical protein
MANCRVVQRLDLRGACVTVATPGRTITVAALDWGPAVRVAEERSPLWLCAGADLLALAWPICSSMLFSSKP